MPAPLSKVQPGQPLRISATAYNAFVDAANGVSSGGGGAGGVISGGLIPGPDDSQTTVIVKNSSAADVPRFGVLGIDVPIVLPSVNADQFKNRVAFNGVTPVIATHTGKFVVCAEPIKKDAYGRAYIAGTFITLVEVTASGDTFADVKASTAELKTGTSGAAQILWKESGTGSGKLAVVRMGATSGGGASAQQFKIKTAASAMVAVCNTWDGTTLGSTDINVRVVTKTIANEIFVASSVSNTGSILWREDAADYTMFPVALTQTGGSAGSKTTKTSFSYTVKDITGTYTYGTGVVPEQQTDYNNRKRKAASIGVAYFLTSGTLKMRCFEDAGNGDCS